MKKFLLFLFVLLLAALGGSVYFFGFPRVRDEAAKLVGLQPTPTPLPTPEPTPTPLLKLKELPITLPMLDALFFADQQFAAELQSGLQLTAEQVAQLRQMARKETTSLSEAASDEAMELPSTTAAGERAAERVSELLGPEKAKQFADFALTRWQLLGSREDEALLAQGAEPLATPSISPLATPTEIPPPSPAPETSPSPLASPAAKAPASAGKALAFIPADTRIVVNTPAYRMDVFQDGQLVKSYKASIGYPEFPVPTGLRKASSIIFNPTWTPPDEPWVESSATVKVGQLIAAGDKLNPLGVLKIPIGAPLLIHGGKPLAKIGKFGSHGCVGLTDRQAQDFAKLLSRLGGVELSNEEITKQAVDRTKTKVVKLKQAVPVELRYETITVEDGRLHIYRDIYDRATNTRENLETVLSANGVMLADLSEAERAQLDAAVTALFPKTEAEALPTPIAASAPPEEPSAATQKPAQKNAQKAAQRKQQLARDKLIKQFKVQKEAVIEIAALAGKGYPAPVELDNGGAPKAVAKTAKNLRQD